MSTESVQREYGSIIVSDPFNRKGYEQKVQVVPITDQWLSSPERQWEEVDSILEGRLHDLQEMFQDPGSNKLAKLYGVEKPLSGNLARLLGYIVLVDEYRSLSEGYSGQAQIKREEYEASKRHIKEGTGGRYKKERQIADLWKLGYNEDIQKDVQSSAEVKVVEDVLLRKAVLEIFSINGDEKTLLYQLPRLLDEARSLFANNLSPVNQKNTEKNMVSYFINTLSGYLSKTQDKALFQRYHYRKSEELIGTKEDCEILDTCLMFALNAESFRSTTATTSEVSKLGSAYFRFLSRFIANQSISRITEHYPQLSLLYDVCTAAFYRGDHRVLKRVSSLIDSNFSSLSSSSMGKNEVLRCISSWTAKVQSIHPEILLLDDKFDGNFMGIEEKLSPTIIEFFTSQEVRLLMGLSAVEKLFHHKEADMSPNTSIRTLVDIIVRDREYLKAYSLPIKNSPIGQVLSAFPLYGIYKKVGLGVDLNLLIDRMFFGKENFQPTNTVGKDELGKQLRGIVTRFNNNPRVPTDLAHERETLSVYLLYFFKDSLKDSSRMELENNFLWDEVLNNAKWFVSPRGDCFRSKGDPQLEDFRIGSLTFRIDKKYPREHSVELKVIDVDRPFLFWFNTQRTILNGDRLPLMADPRFRPTLANFLLRRLYAITSGLLSKEGGEYVEEGDGTKLFEYKRAHYRYLTSTQNHPITMESHGAQVHAKDILEDYGIDIFAEIRRRRSLGTLNSSQYLTFVREMTPGIRGQLVLPNDLHYNPELIYIPL